MLDGPLVERAHAKINLGLQVIRKRPDGYHDIETVMQTVDLADRVTVTPQRSQIEVTCSDPVVPVDEHNLVHRVAQMLRDRYEINRGVRIDIQKQIPVAAGLAGGSGNGAVTLLALNRLWELELAPGELLSLAAELGSDVAFLASGTPAAICRGRGEEVDPVERPLGLSAVIARPESGLSAAEVFRHCRVVDTPRGAQPLVDRLFSGRLAAASRLLHNSLQPTAEALNPEVTKLLNILARQPVLGPLMTGSGTACFGLCTTHRLARRIAARLRAQGVDQVHAVQLGV